MVYDFHTKIVDINILTKSVNRYCAVRPPACVTRDLKSAASYEGRNFVYGPFTKIVDLYQFLNQMHEP